MEGRTSEIAPKAAAVERQPDLRDQARGNGQRDRHAMPGPA